MLRHTVLLALPLLLLAACQNDPDPTSVGIIPDEDLVGAVRFDSQTDSVQISSDGFETKLLPYSSSMLSVGQADGFDASALIRWLYLADSVGGGGRIISARMRLHSLPYRIGDNGPVALEVREITSFWSSFTFSSDSLTRLEVLPEVKGSVTRSLADTDSIDIPLDTTMVREWLRKANSGRFTELRGLLLQSSSGGNIRSFQSAEGSKPPTLEIVIEQNGKQDTLAGQNLEDTYVARKAVPAYPGRIVVQGGSSVRGRLFFDVSAIPANSIINHVSVQFRIDRDLSTKLYRGIDSLLVHINLDSARNVPSSSGIMTSQSVSDPTLLTAQGTILIQAVQNWVNRRGNNGLILIKAAELSDLDRLVVYDGTASKDLRPRLIVTYTTQP
ncbi:MAG: hypothetical protein M5R41_12960 [Bacteroidia bacterium]|nr:hypothetical protein [Bacteroidia bacterium]